MLLVSAVYKCDHGHKLLARDERVLKVLPSSKSIIPFVLHQTGFTSIFIELCQSLCQTGMNFHSLEGVIGHMRWKRFEERRQLYQHSVHAYRQLHQLSNGHQQLSDPSTFKSSMYYKLPSNDTICKCFVAKFLNDEQLYKTAIQLINTEL